MSKHNAFIFNWVKNYDKQVKILKNALEECDNKVIIYNHKTYQELKEIIEELTEADFSYWNYICVIILDNNCKYEQCIQTSVNNPNADTLAFLRTDILTKLQTNNTLNNIKRLFVIQKLLDVRELDEIEKDPVYKELSLAIKRRDTENEKQNNMIIQPGSSITIYAQEYTDNFVASPFIQVFARNFKANANLQPISKIYQDITKEISNEYKYDVNIEFGSTSTPENGNEPFGKAIDLEIIRDFP